MFRNPLVNSGLLGVSSGAGFGACLAIVFLGGGVYTYVLAFAFSLLAVVLSYFAGRVSNVTTSVTLILGGVIVSSFFSALISILKYIADPYSQLPSITYNAVLWAVSKGVTNGDGAADTFNPNGVCTRAHIVTFLFRAAGSPELFDAELTYRDVPAGTWYTVPVIWADSRGITKGDGAPDIFNPNGSCTRAMIVTFLYRASK